MYHSPERNLRNSGARQIGGRAVRTGMAGRGADLDLGRGAQLVTRGHLAPYFAIANMLACGLLAMHFWGLVPLPIFAGWVGGTLLLNLGFMKWAQVQAVNNIGRSQKSVPTWLLVGDVALRAAAILSVPSYYFGALGVDAQLLVASILVGLGIAGLGVAVIPAAVATWFAAFTVAILYAVLLAATDFPLGQLVPIAFTLGVAFAGISLLARAGFGSKSSGRTEPVRQGDDATLLLEEYELRGVGWLWQLDSENRVTYMSSRLTALLGRSSHAVIGHTLPALLGTEGELGRVLHAKETFSALELEIQTQRGQRWITMAGDPILDSTGAFSGFRGVGRDVTEVRQTQERLTHLANVDVLSGLPNRGRVRQLLGESLRSATERNSACAILFLDLDGFKPVNDTFGHPKGDAVLQAVAKRLCDEVGDAGHVGRMGGDEFAIVISDAQSRTGVEGLCNRIIASIAEPYMIEGTEIIIGVSIGCAYGPVDGATVDDLILKADLALYEAKNGGRGTVRYFSSQLQSEQEDRARLESDLRAAISGKQFFLVYQPLVDAQQQKLIGFEALIRWQHPVKGLIPPFQFIPLAEELGLMMEIGDWVINEAIRAAATWPDHITVALNISPKQIVFPALPNTVSRALAQNRVPGNRIELEVTEGVFLGANAQTLDVLNRLRQLGCGIALDDFGTGYSSIGYLNKAVFHKLKIDGSFVREAGTRPENIAIIQSIVQLARSFRMTVTAEGVETAEDFQRMRELGVDTIQGYLFGKPLAYDKANELVRGFAGGDRQKSA